MSGEDDIGPCEDCGWPLGDGGSVGLYCTNPKCPGEERIKQMVMASWRAKDPVSLQKRIAELEQDLASAIEERDREIEGLKRERDKYKGLYEASLEAQVDYREELNAAERQLSEVREGLEKMVSYRGGQRDPAGDGGTYILTGHEYRELQDMARALLSGADFGGRQ